MNVLSDNKMFMQTEFRPLDADELACRKKVLRDAVICIGWLKLVSVIPYVLMYLLAHANSKGHFATALHVMTLLIIPPQVLNGVLLFLGALEEKVLALEVALWLCLILACYNGVLGIMGALYFIRSGHLTLHFILALSYGVLLFSIISVICHDIIVIFAYKKLLQPQRLNEDIDVNRRAITWQDQPSNQETLK